LAAPALDAPALDAPALLAPALAAPALATPALDAPALEAPDEPDFVAAFEEPLLAPPFPPDDFCDVAIFMPPEFFRDFAIPSRLRKLQMLRHLQTT
jgi:hypothetical protein